MRSPNFPFVLLLFIFVCVGGIYSTLSYWLFFSPKHSNCGFFLDKIVYDDCFDEKKIGMIIAIIIGVVLVLENIFLVVCWCYMKSRSSKTKGKTSVEFKNKDFDNINTWFIEEGEIW